MEEKYPIILDLSRNEILEIIEKLAQSYTKEWLMNKKEPDAGSVMALIFADLLKESSDVINEELERHHITFLNMIENHIRVALPAQSFVSFSLLPSDQSNIKIEEGTKLIGVTEEGEEAVFITDEEIKASYAYASNIIVCSKNDDYIASLYDEGVPLEDLNLKVFSLDAENLQKHIFYIGTSYVLNSITGGEVSIYMVTEEQWQQILINPSYMKWCVLTSEGWQECRASSEFKNIEINGEQRGSVKVTLFIEAQPEEGEIFGRSLYWIGLFSQTMEIPEIKIAGIRLEVEKNKVSPEIVYVEDRECQDEPIYPFGKPMLLYTACYISCEEALSKQGAKICFSFYLDFEIVEERLGGSVENSNAVCPAYTVEENQIQADEVIWEYWNGIGWKKLQVNEEAKTIFRCSNRQITERTRKVYFNCPEDMERLTVNANEARWIRVRLIRAEHIYTWPYTEYVPVMSELAFSYEYEKPLQSEALISENNLEHKDITTLLEKGQEVQLFAKIPYDNRCIFLGLETKPSYETVYLFITMQNDLLMMQADISYAFSTVQSGRVIFTGGEIQDATGGLCHSGKVIMKYPKEFEKITLFGLERYWIKIEDVFNQFERVDAQKGSLPSVIAIYPNVAKVINVEMETVYFYEASVTGEQSYVLEADNVIDLEVYVNERPSQSEIVQILENNEHEIHSAEYVNGELKQVWVKWKRVEYRSELDSTQRNYYYDQLTQEISFPNNAFITFPINMEGEVIAVIYKKCLGKAGNVKKGSITELGEVIPYVGGVYQFMDAFGGSDFEQVEESVSRISDNFGQHNRLVSLSDYEALTKVQFPNIIKLRYLPHVQGSNGNQEIGAMTLVVLLEGYEQGDYIFFEYQEAIEAYVKQYSDLYISNLLYIKQPVFIRMDIEVVLSVRGLVAEAEKEKEIAEGLAEFLNPVSGGFEQLGWDIGSIPTVNQIKGYINTLGIPYYTLEVSCVTKVREIGVWQDVDLTTFKKREFILPISGTHSVTVRQIIGEMPS